MAEDIRQMMSVTGIPAFEKNYEKPDVILVDSQYCSMGRMIAIQACRNTEYKYYDGASLLELIPETDITEDLINRFENLLRTPDIDASISENPLFTEIIDGFSLAVQRAASEGRCLIHDIATQQMIRSLNLSCIRVMIRNSGTHTKCIRASRSPLYRQIQDEQLLMQYIQEEDRIRRNRKILFGEDTWNRNDSYDLIIDSETMSRDFSAHLLHQLMI